jgi:hypothetical protein
LAAQSSALPVTTNSRQKKMCSLPKKGASAPFLVGTPLIISSH